MIVIEVDQVRRCAAVSVPICLLAHHPSGVHGLQSRQRVAGVVEVVLVVGEDVAAEAGHGLEIVGRGEAPGLAVMASAVEAALPRPAGARQAVDALEKGDAADDRHRREWLPTEHRRRRGSNFPIKVGF